MSKTTTAPVQEAASANLPAAPIAKAEAISTPKPVAAKAPARKAPAKKPAPAKPAVKPAAKPAAKAAKPAATVDTEIVAKTDAPPPAKPVKESKARKVAVKKPKLVRDSFTFPETDYALLAELKQRALKAGHEIKKSELLRAGLAALAAMAEPDLVKALAGVERIKTGRPAK